MKYVRKTLGLGFLIGFAVAFVDNGLAILSGNTLVLNNQFFIQIGYYLLYSIVLTMVNTSFFDYLNHKVVWEKYGSYRFLIGTAGSISLSMLVIFGLRLLLEMYVAHKSWEAFIKGENPFFYGICLLITVFVSVLGHAIYFYRAIQNKKVKEQKIIAGTAAAKFDALKNQLDPHFLFNSLNVLTSLIEEDPHQAQKFTTSLSKVYRYVLEQKNKDLVFVDEELQFARTYVQLLKMRFEDSIIFDIPDHSSNPEARIIPLSLQLLLENAVKHNIVTSERPLRLSVFEKENNLVVRNNLQTKQVVKKSSGVGLQNIQERYKIVSHKKVIIHKTVSEFRVEIPMLTKQITVMETHATYIEDKRYQKAKEKVEKIKGFYTNLVAYCIVIPILGIINFNTTSFPWAIFPVLGWGFGLMAHGMEAFGYHPLLGKGWEERKMREYMEDDSF